MTIPLCAEHMLSDQGKAWVSAWQDTPDIVKHSFEGCPLCQTENDEAWRRQLRKTALGLALVLTDTAYMLAIAWLYRGERHKQGVAQNVVLTLMMQIMLGGVLWFFGWACGDTADPRGTPSERWANVFMKIFYLLAAVLFVAIPWAGMRS